jgi:hypothetical protein
MDVDVMAMWILDYLRYLTLLGVMTIYDSL